MSHTPDTHYEVTLVFASEEPMTTPDYHRTVQMLGVPRIGDAIACDNHYGTVRHVLWDIGSLPCGRSVRVTIK